MYPEEPKGTAVLYFALRFGNDVQHHFAVQTAGRWQTPARVIPMSWEALIDWINSANGQSKIKVYYVSDVEEISSLGGTNE